MPRSMCLYRKVSRASSCRRRCEPATPHSPNPALNTTEPLFTSATAASASLYTFPLFFTAGCDRRAVVVVNTRGVAHAAIRMRKGRVLHRGTIIVGASFDAIFLHTLHSECSGPREVGAFEFGNCDARRWGCESQSLCRMHFGVPTDGSGARSRAERGADLPAFGVRIPTWTRCRFGACLYLSQ